MGIYDIEYYKRRVRASSQAITPGDTKLILSTIFNSLDDLALENKTQAVIIADLQEKLDETIQSLGSSRTSPARKKLEAKRDPQSDSPGDA